MSLDRKRFENIGVFNINSIDFSNMFKNCHTLNLDDFSICKKNIYQLSLCRNEPDLMDGGNCI